MSTLVSGMIGGYVYGELNTPQVQLFEWDIREYSPPNGVRNIYGGHPAWVKELSITAPMEFEDVVLDFASTISGNYQSRVQCFTVGLSDNDFGISNMRLWMPSGTALQTSGHIEFTASGLWIPWAKLPSGVGTIMPSSLPTNQNVWRQDSQFGNLEWSEDSHTSQFIYLALTVPSGMPLGQYGNGLNGQLSFRVTYDWFYKFQVSGSMT